MIFLQLVPKDTRIDFVKARHWAFGVDAALLVATIVALLTMGLNYGIDFTGGVLVEVRKEQAIDVADVRTSLEGAGFGEVQVQTLDGDNAVMIRVQPEGDIDEGAGAAVLNRVKAALGEGYQYDRVEVVGPKVSGELLQDGIIATILAVLMITVYVVVRFEWQYGIGAFIATAHDVFVTVGLFAVLQLDFNLASIAALLALAGYSINDTVVVYDRIRENRRKYKRMPMGELINLSVNQMLSRTIATSGTTILAILPLLVFGGPQLLNFTAAITFGIIVGTFSSIYVAGAILLYFPPVAGGESGAQEPGVPAKSET